jgi:hypothetical protein
MANYVRSEFCVDHSIQKAQFHQLLQELDRLGCRYNVWEKGTVTGYLEPGNQSLEHREQVLDTSSCPSKLQQLASWLAPPGFVDITLGWQVGEQHFLARLMKWKYRSDIAERISFAVDDSAFLNHSIEFTPDSGDHVYSRFKRIVIEIIKQIRPLVGAIDEEADLLCDTLNQSHSVVSWGNFFSYSLLEQWSEGELRVLRQTVDEYVQVDSLGVLTFIHPLAANQAWDVRHERIDAILRHDRLVDL